MQSLCNLPTVDCAIDGVTLVTTPYSPGNKEWLRGILGRRKPQWSPARQAWRIPRLHAYSVAVAAADRWGACELVTWARLEPTVKCDIRCLQASGDACICSCGGTHHGARALPTGFIVGETTVVMQGERQLVRRVIRRAV